MPLTAGATFAGFTIERRLGSGGMGEVYLARHPRLPRYDAIKLLPPEWSGDEEYRARFTREADLASTLWHPHIVGVHDRGEHEGQLWISMDFVDGNDAAQILAQRFPSGMPPEMVVAIVTAVASALDYAHGQGLLHRDVKPANIMITRTDGTEQPRILLADFGIARNVNETSGLTKTNTAVGTVAYAAPEQLVGDPLDGRTDQYALAATAYHLLTGSQPFPHSNPAVVISRHLTAAPPPISATMPEFPGLDGVFATALAKNPRDRFVRCGDFARALADYARLPSGPAASPPTPAPFPAAQPYPAMQPHPAIQPHPVVQYPSAQPSRTPTNPWVLVALAVTVMVAVGAIALAWQPWNSDESVTRAADSADRSTPRIADVPLPSEPPADSGCVGSVIDHHDIEHPSLGPMRIFLVQDSASGSPLRGCVSGVTADDRALPPIAVAAMENFGFANPATDATGNTFITYNPGRYNGVVILVPDATGFEVTGPDDEGFDASSHDFYYAELVGPGGNGEYTIRQSSNDCEPDCAGGTITTEDFRWNGRDYVS